MKYARDAKTALLLVNLGTPDSARPRDVKRYLTEFLTDAKVIDLPWIWRQLLVRGSIIPKRYRQSAKSYQEIWMEEGSPLLVYGEKVKQALQQKLGDEFHVELGMRYQKPSLESAIDRLLSCQPQQLTILPLFPQYASATTGSVQQKIMKLLQRRPNIPSMSFIAHFCDHPLFIKAIAARAAPYRLSEYEKVLFSFHGLPQRQLIKSNPELCSPAQRSCCRLRGSCQALCYTAQCYATAKALAQELRISHEQYGICFQSRLGKEKWLEPYTNESIAEAARQGVKRLLIFCPSFTSDCLETLYEIAIEYKHEFLQAGGEKLDLVPGLNDHSAWIDALAQITRDHVPPRPSTPMCASY